MAQRFLRGGRLLAVGEESDARHVAVEFVHPVIVGKRALPALALPTLEALELERESDDIVVIFSERGVRVGDESFFPPTDDPFVRQELVETLYHVLWELVHVFLEHRDRSLVGAGAASFLYPFLDGGPAGHRRGARGRAALDRGQGARDRGAARADAGRERVRARPRPPRLWARACWRWATAARRRTRWTSSPTSARAGGARWT